MPSPLDQQSWPSTIPDDEWAELSQGLPHPEDPQLKRYLTGRQTLINLEKQQRSDSIFRRTCSPLATKSCAIVDKIRDEEQKTIWTTNAGNELQLREESPLENRDPNIHVGMMFHLAKKQMEQTKLWKILKQMPKGALLHAHLEAMVDLDFLFDALLSTPGMHICSMTSLIDPIRENASFKFQFVRSKLFHDNVSLVGRDFQKHKTEGKISKETEEAGCRDGDGGGIRCSSSNHFDHLVTGAEKIVNIKSKTNSIWSPDYIPETMVPVTEAADSFPNGGRQGFLSWLRDRCRITEKESIEKQYQGVDAVWRKFSSVFLILNTIIFYEPIFRRCLQKTLSGLYADGIRWVDFRLTFVFKYYQEEHDEPDSDFRHLFQVFDEELEKFKSTVSDKGQGFWGSRIIWSGLRILETRKIIEDMEACISIKLIYPHLISGYDLVGQEDAGRSLKDLLPELLWFKSQCVAENIEIPFFFHAGECLGDGSETDQNLFDAILLGTRRIGHGFSLYKHPLLIDLVKEKKILVESCPISNEVLRLCSSVTAHSLPGLLSRGVACSLSNDDPTILGHDTVGLTHDFWQALQGWDNLGLAGLASMAENSVRWAAFEDENSTDWLQGIHDDSAGTGIRAKRLKQWRMEWEEFCLWINAEFGSDY